MGPEEESTGGGGGGGGGSGGATVAGAAASKSGKMRIYVGGLGGNVTADDLKKTFSSPQLGAVESVEIVRTKGRSFAYLEFIPCSEKGLAKLFSMYNGCMWKGGRLRLEKAKEQYILRLRREWAEDSELSSDSHSYDCEAVGSRHSSEKLVKDHSLENMQLRIFFPKLRKVKPVPLKGTGKHKYSFQRVEVPPLPIHFCDCEEHSGPSGTAEEPCSQENEIGGMNEEELNMMKSVMNKLFERENIFETPYAKFGVSTGASISTNSIDDIQVDDEANQLSDDDNLVMNMVAGSNNEISLTDTWGQRAITGNQDFQTSKTRLVQRTHGNRGMKIVTSNKKRKTPLDHEPPTNGMIHAVAERKGYSHSSSDDLKIIPGIQSAEPGSGIQQSSSCYVRPQKSAWKDLVSGRDDGSFRISDVLPSVGPGVEKMSKSDNSTVPSQENRTFESSQVKEVNKSTEAVCDTQNAEVNKGGRGTSWLQKSSWTHLVGSNSSFSISQIVPGINIEKDELPQLNGIDHPASLNNGRNFMKTDDSDFTTDASEPQVTAGMPISSLANSDPNQACLKESNPVQKLQPGKSGDGACTPPFSEKQQMRVKRTSIGDTGIDEIFTFKRSTASLKEWKKAKAALSGSRKKKINDN